MKDPKRPSYRSGNIKQRSACWFCKSVRGRCKPVGFQGRIKAATSFHCHRAGFDTVRVRKTGICSLFSPRTEDIVPIDIESTGQLFDREDFKAGTSASSSGGTGNTRN